MKRLLMAVVMVVLVIAVSVFYFTSYWPEHWMEFGQLLAALIGLPLVIWHVSGVHNGVKAQTLGGLYDHYFSICRAVLNKPHLRTYLYGTGRLGATDTENHRAEVDTLCECMTGLLEHAAVQRHNVPKDAWSNCWLPFLKHMYANKDSQLVDFYQRHKTFYAKDFREIVDPLL